jgi:hypothetical protein
MPEDFNPRSIQVMLGIVIERLDQQDLSAKRDRDENAKRMDDMKRDLLAEVLELKNKVDYTNGSVITLKEVTRELPAMSKEVDSLSTWRTTITAKVATTAVFISIICWFAKFAFDVWISKHG